MREIDRSSTLLPVKPYASSLTRWFWQSLSEGRLETTMCTNCGEKVFPPRPDCPVCLHRSMTWIILRGSGVLYSKTVVYVVPERLIDEAPLPIGIVDLDEGLRILCALVGDDAIDIGSRVEIVSIRYQDGNLFGATAADAHEF